MADDHRTPQWGDDAAGVTKQELLSTVIAVFLIGTLFGWAVFGKPRLVDAVLHSESLADWLAAAAAWVIGIAAWRYQRASHEIARKNDLRIARTMLMSALWKSSKAARIRDPFEILFSFEKDEQNMRNLSETLEISIKQLGALQWTENERSYLDDKAMAALVELEHRLMSVVDVYGYAKTAIDKEDPSTPIPDELKEQLEKLEKIGNDLADAADAFSKHAKRLRDSLVTNV